MKVSILMSVTYRPTLWRTLESWCNLNWDDVEFLICDNGSENPDMLKNIVMGSGLNVTQYIRRDVGTVASVAWNELYKLSTGEFIIITMQDEIISNKDIIQHMLDAYVEGERVSVVPFELDEVMTSQLDTVDWKNNPKLIETLPRFWEDEWCSNSFRMGYGAGLLTHTTGQYRKDWDYLGMFRWEEGYLLQDRDIHLREQVLKKAVHTPKTVVTYHQFHKRWIADKYIKGPSFTYRTEREARLLDPVEPD